MFVFAFVKALFVFAFAKPAFALLFELPPKSTPLTTDTSSLVRVPDAHRYFRGKLHTCPTVNLWVCKNLHLTSSRLFYFTIIGYLNIIYDMD